MTGGISSVRKQSLGGTFLPRRFRVYTERHMDQIARLNVLPAEDRFAMAVVAKVLPFRVNEYVINSLIDWDHVPDDPIFRLTFPQREMLSDADLSDMASLLRGASGNNAGLIAERVSSIRASLNPHPAEQTELNVPGEGSHKIAGLQHKYRETVLFFPSEGQTCHSYCTFCFRWAQFVGNPGWKIATREAASLHRYLRDHGQVTDLLITGGDPMVMKASTLAVYTEPLLGREFEHVQTLRIGTKSLSFWPYRFVTDSDADDLLRLLERLVNAGKHVAIMAHYNHPRELSTDIAREAIRRLRDTGVQIRSQGPILRHINDDARSWAELWSTQVALGIVPYYMFVERDTGAQHYFEVPLLRAWEIYREAMQMVSGIGRTARGPSMSAGPGKIEVQGVAEIHGERVFVLRFIQGRDADWVQRPFFARFDPQATWLDQLEPAFGERSFFFEDEYEAMKLKRVQVIDRC